MKTVIVINGRPRAGKDTAVAFMRAALTAEGIPNTSFSSIDPIKEMLAPHVNLRQYVANAPRGVMYD